MPMKMRLAFAHAGMLLAGLLLATGLGHAEAGVLRVVGPGGDYAVPVTSMRELRFKATLRQQYDFSCGSAAVATLLTHHYHYPITEEAVFAAMYAHGDQQKIRKEGFSLLDIKQFLESRGFHADGFQQPLDKLEGARLPAIALMSDHGYHHFVIIKGIRGDRILIGDPSSGTRAIARQAFETMWVNHLLFVIHNQQQIARFNDDADWLVAPRGPLSAGIDREGLGTLTLPKLGAGEF
jgi:uncharacterized protein